MFWNSLDEQNPKLSLGVQFDQVHGEKTENILLQKIGKSPEPVHTLDTAT